jgi:integrase
LGAAKETSSGAAGRSGETLLIRREHRRTRGKCLRLRWEWERKKIKELGRSVFVVPGTATKNSEPFVIVPNDVAMNVIDSCRGDHDEFVFVYTDEKKGLDPDRMDRLNGRAYRKVRKRANLEQVRIHDLRHTYGSKLRDAGVSEEDRAVLMGHSTASMPSHYAAPTIKRLVALRTACRTRATR